MGKGDIKSTKGKRTRGSYGNTRKREKPVKIVAAKPKKKAAPKKTAVKKLKL
jgi:30S ribosomal protein S31